MSKYSDLTILIQGKLTKEALDFYLDNYQEYNMIISTWNNNILKIPERDNLLVIKKQELFDPGHQNINLQIFSTKAGLEKVNTKYCIKMRGDEYVSNIDYIYDEIKKRDHLLLTLPIWFRKWDYYKYHISDHLIGGQTDNLKLMFHKAWTKPKHFCAEITLTRAYLESKMPDFFTKPRTKEIMKEYFDILDLEKLKPYLLIANVFGGRYENNFIPEQGHSISRIEDI